MKNYYHYILHDSETRIEKAMKNQVCDTNDAEFGAIYDSYEYTEPKPTVYRICTGISIYLNKDSRYYKSELVYNFILSGFHYVEKNQREDGTFDLVNCNFYSAPDTAFIIKKMIPSYRLLERFAFDTERCGKIQEIIYRIIEKAVKGMCLGGFHTPNHRWAIASVLASSMDILKDETIKELIKKHIDAYLFEGIDCNSDGEYAERSAATYNVVNNKAMLDLYENLESTNERNNEQYFEYMCHNLEMMLSYFKPDGSIFTDNSTRQDKGKKIYPRDYFILYLYAAYKTGRADFDAAAHKIIKDGMLRGDNLAPDCLDFLMLRDELLNYSFQGYGFPKEYKKFFSGSGIVRIQNEHYSLSLMKQSTKIMVFQVGETSIYLKIGVNYFDKRSFVAQSIEEIDGVYHLRFSADGWYYLPFTEKPETSDWWAMGNENREKIIKNNIDFNLMIEPKQKGVDVTLKTSGTDRVMVLFEIGVPPEGLIENENIFLPCSQGHAILIKSGIVNIKNKSDKIQFGPGFCSHKFIDGKFGAEERSTYFQTVYFTATTNFEKSFTFTGL